MLGPLAKEHLKMTYHQTLNIPITLGRRPTEGTPADFKESHWDCLKEEKSKDTLLNPSTKRISLEKRQIPWEMETERSQAPIQRRQGLPGTLVPRHTTAEDEGNTKEMISAENTKIRTFYRHEGEREARDNFLTRTRLTHW